MQTMGATTGNAHDGVPGYRATITVVVTTYNRSALLRDALGSIARSERGGFDAGVIVVDNNSGDDTEAVVESISQGDFPFPLAYLMERAQGLSYARNRGLREAGGDYVVFVDDDQLIDARYLRRLPLVFADTGAACIGGPIRYDDLDAAPRWLRKLCREHGEHELGDRRLALGAADGRLWGGNMAFDRRELLAAGGFDVHLGHRGATLMSGEDFELQQRLRTLGKRIIYDPGLVQYHRLGRDRFDKGYWRRRYLGYGRSQYIQNEQRWRNARRTFRIPRRLWWQLLKRDLAGYLRSLLKFDPVWIFQHELYVWRQIGWMLEARGWPPGDGKRT